jgi:hypothetical protein
MNPQPVVDPTWSCKKRKKGWVLLYVQVKSVDMIRAIGGQVPESCNIWINPDRVVIVEAGSWGD